MIKSISVGLALFLILVAHASFSQKVIISGTVRDAESGEILVGASVVDSISGTGVQSSAYGFFSITIPSPKHDLKVSYVGYSAVYLRNFKAGEPLLDVRLIRSETLKEVSIVERKEAERPLGSLSVTLDKIKAMPALLGEVDVLKALSFTPGVSTGTEGSAGLYVRGGTPDQNLILLDEVPVYNVTHLGGFFSVFNPNSLKSVDLYKGAFPARYGGRIASVVDLTMRDGNNRKFGGEVGLGLLNQNLTLEGPIIKNKASFIVSGRISTLGLSTLLKKVKRSSGSGETYAYRFYDFNAKVNYQINNKEQIFLSFYSGFDRFEYGDWSTYGGRETGTSLQNNWGNNTATISYRRVLSEKLFARAALLYTNYTSEFANNFQDVNSSDQSVTLYRNTNAGVRDLGGKVQFEYFPVNRFNVKFGLEATRHTFFPFVTKSNYNGSVSNTDAGKLPANQFDAFLDSDIWLRHDLRLNAGLRYSLYRVNGRKFNNPEPRLGARWNFARNWALKMGGSVMNQYVHLLTNNGYGFGYDAWLPSTEKVSPSRSAQLSFGLSKEFPEHGVELGLELYGRRMRNLIDYPDGTNFTGLLASSWDETVIKHGTGRARGIEFMANKTAGKFSGWLSYTLASSERKFTGINDGDWFPMKYDRRHSISFAGTYALNEKWKLSTTFIFQTGHAITLPEAALLTEGSPDPRFIYNGRNNGRMPNFHRLDLGASKALITPRKRKAELRMGLYNAYNRSNPLYLDFKIERRDSDFMPIGTSVKQVSFFPILPYISYSLKF